MPDFVEVMQTYFRGEKATGLALAGVAALMLGFAYYVYRTQAGPFMWGLVLPLAIVGALALIGGPLFGLRQDQLAADIARRYREDPAELARAERARMARVNANWPRLEAAWLAIAVVAMGMVVFAHRDWARGVGLAFVLLTALLFVVDVFAERRAVPYTEALAVEARE